MARKLRHLKPGDLITADFINAIVDALNSPESRVSAVEARLARVPADSPLRGTAKGKRKA